MQIVPTTFVALLALLIIIRLGPRRGLWVFFALTPLGAAAAVNLPALGGASIVLADAAAVALFAMVLTRRDALARLLATMRPFAPGFLLLVLFAFMVFATLFLPRIFAGETEVFGVARVDGQVGIVSRPLRPTTGNITQLFRLSLGVMIFLTLATVFRREPDASAIVKAMAVDVSVHAAFGVLDVATFELGMAHLMDVVRTANYAMAYAQIMAGLKRMVGGFPEASAFGYHTMAVFGFWLQYWFDRGRFRHAGLLVLVTTTLLILSTSTSAYVAGALFLCTFAAFNTGRFLSREVNIRAAGIMGAITALMPVVLAAVVVAYQTVPEFTAYLDRILLDKINSDSAAERMSWNAQALRNFTDTWLVGAGLGSVRASNWLIANLASIGILGTLLYLAFLAAVARCAPPRRGGETAIVMRSLKMGCLALLARAMVVKATPNLELIFFAMAGLVVGLAASASISAGPARAPAARAWDETRAGP